MPIYSYKCNVPSCSYIAELFRNINDRNFLFHCSQPGCAGIMERFISGEAANSYGKDYAGEGLLSDAMGVAPDQVDQHRRAHPDIPLTNDGRVICRNVTERKRIMKRLGFVDLSGYN